MGRVLANGKEKQLATAPLPGGTDDVELAQHYVVEPAVALMGGHEALDCFFHLPAGVTD